jgi:hypothetical protein
VRRANSCCAATAASRAARRAAFVVAPLAIGPTVSPLKPLLPHPNLTRVHGPDGRRSRPHITSGV